jgi:hypothetical protein
MLREEGINMAKIIDKTALEAKRFDEIPVGTYFKYFDKLFVKLNGFDDDDGNAFCFDAGKGKGNPTHVDSNVLVTEVDVEIIVKPLGC